jgi:hypothetical protein
MQFSPPLSVPPLLTNRNTLYLGFIDAPHPHRYVQSSVASRGFSPVSARAEKPRENSSCNSRKGSGFVSAAIFKWTRAATYSAQ